METPLLKLTPIYLQNTDTILNTLLFMCLDQGHDFHDGSARTKTPDGKATWVDLDFNGKGFLNKISSDIFESEYANVNEGIITTDKIFGNNDFIKGLLNTTFIGGNGAYGLVVIDEINNSKLGNRAEELIEKTITSNIIIRLTFANDKYYIYTENDTKGEKGKNFTISEADNADILFLPFYQRVYNGNMHKLWTFNTKKYIYIIKLQQFKIISNSGGYDIIEPIFKCELFTTIDLIVPQYILNFAEFYSSKNNSNYLYQKLTEYGLIPSSSRTKITLDDKFFTDNKDKLYEIFSQALFSGNFNIPEQQINENSNEVIEDNPLSEEDNTLRENDDIQYITSGETGKFLLKFNEKTIELSKCVPRGTKYYFSNCQDSIFRKFLRLLYENQKPIIHNNYQVNNKIELSKEIILQKVIDNGLLNEYNENKKNMKIVDDDNFISKQYGFITDTNIGSGIAQSTADILIDSLNGVNLDTNCPIDIDMDVDNNMVGGGDLDILVKYGFGEPEIQKLIDSAKTPKFSLTLKRILDKLNEKQLTTEDCNELSTIFTNFFGKPIKVCETKPITGLKRPFTEVSVDTSTTPVTTAESITPEMIITQPTSKQKIEVEQPDTVSIQTMQEKPEMEIESITIPTIEKEEKPEIPIESKVIFFDNVENVNKTFDLNLNTDELNKEQYTNINSNTASVKPFEQYIKQYSNNLQLYYDFKQQIGDDIIQDNYFNNCWLSNNFYQKGGSPFRYPFKFTIASGSLDSSSLGGQSIPQYHPPEVDIYMPIFELTGQGKLKGVIIRMVIVKEILNNLINSKSQVVVFCHFVYIDFERSGITEPTNKAQYPQKFKELLEYTINNTVYIKTGTKCLNIDELKSKTDLNEETDIDFKLNLADGRGRYWYKYFTFTQGPTVKNSIVIPTNFFTLDALKLKASFDYVASGIINVAENLIKKSGKLREVFSGETGEIYFIKLFLIRNKYTGDKSRSTDTLFLNQSKYLEGVQISNDENTLYNSQMFGLNTIWSTSAKSVFYMTPYLTENNRLPITTGSYIDTLCNGLKNNPNNKTTISGAIEGSSKESDEKSIFIDEFMTEILNKISREIQDELKNNKKFKLFLSKKDNFLYSWSEGLYFLELIREELENFKNMSLNEINQSVIAYKEDKTEENLKILNDKIYNIIRNSNYGLEKKYKNFIDLFNEVNKNKKTYYGQLIKLLDLFNTSKEKLFQLNDMIMFLSKTFPWWIDLIIKNILDEFKYLYCKKMYEIFESLNNLIENETPPCDKFKIYNFLIERIKEYKDFMERRGESAKRNPANCNFINYQDPNLKIGLTATCNEEKAKEIKKINIPHPEIPIKINYLKELDGADIETLSKEQQIIEIEKNEKKFIKASTELLKGILNKNIKSANDITTKLNNNIILLQSQQDVLLDDSSLFEKIRPKKVTTAETLGGSIKGGRVMSESSSLTPFEEIKPFQIKEMQSILKPKTDILYESINQKVASNITPIGRENLENFYKSSYKCNIGNYLKSFLPIISYIDSKYSNISFDTISDSKELLIKILMLNINLINESFTPIVTSNDIISIIKNIDGNYTLEQLINIFNLYAEQLDMYMIIYGILNTDYTPIQLVNLLNENITDHTYQLLNIPFTKYDFQQSFKELVNENSDINDNFQNQIKIVEPSAGANTRKNIKNKKLLQTKKNNRHIKNKTIRHKILKQKKYTR